MPPERKKSTGIGESAMVSAAVRRQHGLHVKAGLGGAVGVLQADGTGVAGQAAAIETVLLVIPGLLLEVTDTGRLVVGAVIEGIRRAGGKTRFVGATLARTGVPLGTR
jgi:hypothetical protein